MAAVVAPDVEEMYLLALMDGADGIDLAEWSWVDEEQDDGCFRCWDVQWSWYTCPDVLQIDQAARSLGKSVGIQMRAYAFPFNHPGAEMLITAPELNHLRPLSDAIEMRLLGTRMSAEMLPRTKGRGIARQPHWQARFVNSSRITTRLPNRDGKGVKGQHPLVLEGDEMQDYPLAGWIELIETLKRGSIGAQWRCLAEGQKVLTDRGLVPIELVKVGDLVWTHRARWRSVVNVFDNGLQECVRVAGRGHYGIEMTPDHKVLLGSLNRQKVGSKALIGQDFTPISQAAWDRRRQSAWASPAGPLTPEAIPALLVCDASCVEWLWLYGLYLAEGYSSDYVSHGQRHRRVSWCVNDAKCDEVQQRLAALGIRSYFYRQGRSVKVVATGADLHGWLVEAAGRLAHGKRLATWVFGLSEEQRQAVLDGMIYGDGYSGRRGRHEYATVSHDLALGVKLLAQSLGNVCSLSFKPRPLSDREIDGRMIHSGPYYTVIIQFADGQQRKQSLIVDGMVWSPVNPKRDIFTVGERHVYDLEVAEDHSYVVEGVVVSNCHGVSRGVRDKYYELTQEDSDFTVHRVLAMHRPSWTSQERAEKIKTYGGSRQNPDYKRNIYGEHGDASNPLFVLSRLMGCVDQDEGSQYNTDVYANISIDFERLSQSKTHPDDRLAIRNLIELPGTHLSGHELAPKGYSAYYGGMDIGVTNHPSEILVFGARAGRSVEHLDLLTRIHLERIDTDDQEEVVKHLFAFYGAKFKAFGLDKTGVGFTASQRLSKDPLVGARVHGYNFSEKVIVGFAERELAPGETQEDLAVWRNVVEHASDVLRIHYVDPRKLTLPFDRELLTEWQGQNYAIVKSAGSPYGRRDYSRGKFHTLDAGKMAAAARTLPLLAEMATYVAPRPPVLDIFVGA